jgi:hypothetical protein
MALGIVERAELRRSLPQTRVGSENAASALTLIADLVVKAKSSAHLRGPRFRDLCRLLNRSVGVFEVSVLIRVQEFGIGTTEFTYDATHLALPTLKMWK